MAIEWRGVFPAITTQMNEQQEVDYDATLKHLEVLIESGISGIVLCGSLGENATLTPTEKYTLVQTVVRAVAGRIPVLTGIAENSTVTACKVAQDAEKIGVDGIMLLPGMIYKSDDTETLTHYRTVADATDLPILIYNNPVAYGVDITPRLLESLADNPKFQAIKESSADVRRLTDIYNLLGDRFALFTGVDDLALESVLLGAVGWIAGAGLAFPFENQRLWDLAVAGRWEEAREIYRWMMPILHLDIGTKFVQKIKLAVQETGLGKEYVRQPRLILSGTEREEVLSIVHKAIETRPTL